MKLLPYKRKLFLDRHSRLPSKSIAPLRHQLKATPKAKPRAWPSVEVPEVLRINHEEMRAGLLSAIASLRQTVGTEGKHTVLDFSRTRKAFADGMLLLYAEVRRLRFDYPQVKIKCRLPANSKVAEVLKQIGLLDLLGCGKKITPSRADVIHWNFATGSSVDGERYEDVVGIPFEGSLAQPLHEALYVGMTEAMTNVIHHAYDGARDDGLIPISQKQWWMFSTAKEGYLNVVLCDLGVGIPRTFPFKHPTIWNWLTSLGKTKDADVLTEAVKLGATRTGQDGRGRGLWQLLDFVNQLEDSHLTIHSNSGVYYKQRAKTGTYNFRDSILGTLIQWRIPLRQA